MNKMQRLEKALDWAMRGNRIVDYGSGIEGKTSGCGCCSYTAEIPEELRAELVASHARITAETEAQP
jgi:hypothetical protein